MQVQTQKIDLIGFDKVQETVMRMKLSKATLPQGDITIRLNQPIAYGQCDCCWYGGPVATASCNNDKFTLVANGNVRATLIDKISNKELAYVKDNSNGGLFHNRMCSFIKNDAHLYDTLDGKEPHLKLNLYDVNWFEIFFNKVKGVTTDKSYVSDLSNIFDAIAEMVDKMSMDLLPY